MYVVDKSCYNEPLMFLFIATPTVKPGSQYDVGAYLASVVSSLVHMQYDTGAYVASVASSLVHNMILELT